MRTTNTGDGIPNIYCDFYSRKC